MSKKKNYTPKKKSSPADKLVNIIITVLILVFIGLSAWAISPNIMKKINDKKAEQQAALPDTIFKKANELGISVDQFISDYGITGENITGDTMLSEVVGNMTLDNYVKLENTTLEEFISSNGLPETVTGDMTVNAANELTPIKTVIASSGMDFETFKSTYELADDVTEDTPWSQVQEAVMQKASQMQADAQAQQDSADDKASQANTEAESENSAE